MRFIDVKRNKTMTKNVALRIFTFVKATSRLRTVAASVAATVEEREWKRKGGGEIAPDGLFSRGLSEEERLLLSSLYVLRRVRAVLCGWLAVGIRGRGGGL
jgi:hypothetical protein